jgi:hypothetical protein
MIELVAEITDRGAILPDGKALMTVEQAKAFISERLKIMELAVAERVSAALSRHDQLNYDLKQFHRVVENQEKAFAEFGPRLHAIEERLGIDPYKVDPEHPGKGSWKLTMQTNIENRPQMPDVPRLTGPAPAWHKEAEAAAKKLSTELPAKVSILDLVRLWGVSYNRINMMIGKGKLQAVREGVYIHIPREQIVEYVKAHGIPQSKKRQYGTAGIVEENHG